MKIQNINNYMSYKGNSKPIKQDEINKAQKYDVIEIKSRKVPDDESNALNSIKKNIVSQVNKETKADKIKRIKESINNKNYSIDVEEIVKKMLE